MKRIVSLLLAALILCTSCAWAESAASVYDTLCGLIGGRTFTLAVTAESEAAELAEVIAQYGTITCTLRQEGGRILLAAACDGDAYLNAAATKEGVRFETSLPEPGVFSGAWDSLAPQVSADEGRVSITMTGPDHELIRFTCRVSGEDADNCQVEIDIGYITGPGNVHSLWDGITNENGETSREFFFTFSEEEYGLEGEGATAVETAGDGSLIITREETCMLAYQEDELGEITFRSVLTIR